MKQAAGGTRFIIIGENIHCTRVVKREGARGGVAPDGRPGVRVLVFPASRATYLEALGIGSRREPTLGMTIFWMRHYGAFLREMWWWIAGPVTVIILILTSLTLISFGLDEVANPRVRRRV